MNTSKQDHKDRALATIAAYISNPDNTVGWLDSDLKTTWILRAKHIGVDGYSSDLLDAFIAKEKHQTV